MKINYLIFFLLVIFVVFAIYYNSLYLNIKSNTDGKIYKVRNNKYAQESSDVLGTINKRLSILVDSIRDNENITFILPTENYLNENLFNMDTTYTINKSSIYFCLSPRDSDTGIYDINTLMYVALHELAHIASKSIGHTIEFYGVFEQLKKFAIKYNIWKYTDYSKNPQEYCGLIINKT